MKIYNKINKKIDKKKNGIISIGYFDGVHIGHEKILKELVRISNENNLENYVLTFDKLPVKNSLKNILLLEDKIELIKSLGVKNLILLNSNNGIFNIKAIDFLYILRKNFNINSFLIAKDFHFGFKREGNEELIKAENFNIYRVDPVIFNGEIVSTSLIKNFIIKGDVDKVVKLMDRNFYIKGIVKKGKQLGRKIGFPTMNIIVNEIILPQSGSYITKTYIKDKEFFSMSYVSDNLVETYLVGYNEFKYNFNIKIDFFKKIRDNKKFNSLEELKIQLNEDLEYSKNYFNIS